MGDCVGRGGSWSLGGFLTAILGAFRHHPRVYVLGKSHLATAVHSKVVLDEEDAEICPQLSLISGSQPSIN